MIDRLLRSGSVRLRRAAEGLELRLQKRRLRECGAGHAYSIPTWTTPRELTTLYALAASLPRGSAGLEIGSYLGVSALHLAAGLGMVGGRLICVDTWMNDTIPGGSVDTFAEFLRHTEPVRALVTPLRKDSSGLCPADLPPRLALAFLDGDHSYEGVRRELRLLAPLIPVGGILAFHDAVAFEGVARTVGEALASGGWQFGGNVDSLVWLRKVVWQEPTYETPKPPG